MNRWRRLGAPTRTAAQATDLAWRPRDHARYAYLLGVYLGDGCVTTPWDSAELQIYLDSIYPGIVAEVERAILAMMPSTKVHRYRRPRSRAVVLQSWTRLWLVAFPQHGPGKKHQRRIELVEWQREITAAYPRELIRGLIHSDGCRTVNRFHVDLPVGGRRRYEYVRYFFSNLSADIRAIFTDHCDLLGIRWSLSNSRNVSVSSRASVALLDSFVGPKA